MIRRNYVCPGNDGVSISEIKENYLEYERSLLDYLENNTYVFEKNPRSLAINDYLGKKRNIFVYNVTERWVQKFLRLQIEPFIESVLVEYVYAFRRGKSDVDSYKYILKNNPKFILRVDIEDYFNSVDQKKLFEKLKKWI